MAAVRLIALHTNKGRTIAQTLGDRTDYAKNPEKTEKGELVTAYGCDPITVDEEFMLQKRLYYQVTRRSRTELQELSAQKAAKRQILAFWQKGL